MVERATIGLFAATALMLVIVPGPNTLYIVTRSMHQGHSAGFVSCVGIALGTLVHLSAAALGLSALLRASTLLFSLVQYAGVALLWYLGIKTMLAPSANAASEAPGHAQPLGTVLVHAMAVNILNPKTALFFIALLPQFVDASKGDVATQILLLGGLLITLGAVSDMMYALIAGRLGEWLRSNDRFWRVQRYLAGAVYIGIGVVAALTGGVGQ